jgi:hypothetical protein
VQRGHERRSPNPGGNDQTKGDRSRFAPTP